jgi:muramoyltetrapeptide carboxypeptidase
MPSSENPVKPRSLEPGDTIGIVAPASPIQRSMLEAGCQYLSEAGYRTFYFDNIFHEDMYFAGPPGQRARDIEEMFERDDVSAVICARGGYGANYVLPYLDIERLKKYPKIFMGYSDVTSLLTWMSDAGLVVFHGPMVTKDFATPNGVHWPTFNACVSGRTNWVLDTRSIPDFRAIVRGTAEGTLYGGCLSLLAASIGTKFAFQSEGKILFIEDVAAKPYQIDRMLMQMKMAGKFEGVRGIIFGEMIDCSQPGGQNYALDEVIRRILRDLRIPVAFGLPSGHVSYGNVSLPFGIRVSLTADYDEGVRLEFLESATEAKIAMRSSTGQNV